VTIILAGLNHKTAPVQLREQLSLSGCALRMALEALGDEPLQEHAILSTCNRLEIYAVSAKPQAGFACIERFLSRVQNIPLETLRPHLYFLEGDAAIHHLMRVACGLESMILGESQILGQVTQAFEEAHNAGATGALLSHLLTQAIHAGKRARTETDINRHTTSISHAAALLAQAKLPDLPEKNLLIIGAGEMALLAAQAFARHGAKHFKFINRTYHRAEALAQNFGGEALSWYQLSDALVWADVVVSATGAPHTIIYAADVQKTLYRRGGRSLLFVDIAVPRDIEQTVADLPGVERCDIDALQSTVDHHLSQRLAAVPLVEQIIAQEKAQFLEWMHSRQVVPVISSLQRRARMVAEAEVEQALSRLNTTDPHTMQVLNRLAHRLVNKLLHEPTIRLKTHAVEGNGHGYAFAVSELFGLEENACHHQNEECERGEAGCNLQCIVGKS
jgi:glutamyl-tRNA reductase